MSDAEQPAGELPPASFSVLVQVLASPVYVHLGVVENPATGQHEKNLEQARWALDLLHVLKEKSAGNITEDEEQMIDQVVHQLRGAYMAARG